MMSSVEAIGDGDGVADLAAVDRARLQATAFRLLGTRADAEDAVQEAYARYYRLDPVERAAVRNPAGWLTTVVGRVCLDVLGSARARRERYVGPWLPEPLPGSPTSSAPVDPAERVTLDDEVTSALMVVLETLTPAERVAFVLHDVFGLSFREVADVVGRTPEACRTLASAARRDLRERRVRDASPEGHDRVVRGFALACATGDLAALLPLLDPDVTLRSDGGGVVSAARNPVHGADRVARFLLGLLTKDPSLEPSLEPVEGRTGVVLRSAGSVVAVATFHVVSDVVEDVWIVVNPEKLTAWS